MTLILVYYISHMFVRRWLYNIPAHNFPEWSYHRTEWPWHPRNLGTTCTHYRIEGSMLNLLCFRMPSTIAQLLKSQITICQCNRPLLEIFIIYDLFHIWLQLLLIKIVIFQAQSSYGTIYLMHYLTALPTINFHLVYLNTCLNKV